MREKEISGLEADCRECQNGMKRVNVWDRKWNAIEQDRKKLRTDCKLWHVQGVRERERKREKEIQKGGGHVK